MKVASHELKGIKTTLRWLCDITFIDERASRERLKTSNSKLHKPTSLIRQLTDENQEKEEEIRRLTAELLKARGSDT